MAERNLVGTDWLLFIDPAGGVDWKEVVCLTTQSINRTTNKIDATTKCGTSSAAGTRSAEVPFEGEYMLDPDTGRVSGGDLHTYWSDSTIFSWKIGKVIPAGGDVTYTGTGFLTSLSDTFPIGNGTFSGTISVASDITQTIAAGGPVGTFGTVVPGSGYVNGTYTNVPLTGGTGAGAKATIVVAATVVSTVTKTVAGDGYLVADVLSALAANIGGTGTGFNVPVATIL